MPDRVIDNPIVNSPYRPMSATDHSGRAPRRVSLGPPRACAPPRVLGCRKTLGDLRAGSRARARAQAPVMPTLLGTGTTGTTNTTGEIPSSVSQVSCDLPLERARLVTTVILAVRFVCWVVTTRFDAGSRAAQFQSSADAERSAAPF